MKNTINNSSTINLKFLVPVIIAVIVLVSSAIFYYNYEERRIKNEKYGELKAIAQLKKDQLVKWRAERLSEAAFFPAQKQFIEFTKTIINNPKENLSKDYFNLTLKQLKNNHNYQNIFITGGDGKIYFTLDSNLVSIDSVALTEFKKAFNQKKILINDFYYCNTHNQIHLDFISPILDEENNPLALLVFRIDPKDYLFPLIDKWPLPSKTGESLLLRVEDQNVIYLSPLNNNKNRKLTIKNSLFEKELISVKGALGQKGIIEGKSYNGKEYLADISFIDNSPWFIISQIELSEVYSELRFRAVAIAVVVFLSLVAFISGIMLLFKYKQSSLYKKMFLQEKELSEAKEEFKTALYSIGDGVITTDTRGCIKHMNYVAENLTGYKESESLGKKIEEVFKIISEDTRNKIENPIQKVLNEGKLIGPTKYSILISKNSLEIPIANSGSPIRNNSGETIGVVLVFRDQTSERKVEKKLKESEEQFRLISDLTTDYLFSTRRDENGYQKMYWVAGAFEKITGYTVEEYNSIGGWRATLVKEDLEKDLEDFHKLERNEKVVSEIRNYHKDGSIIWVRSYAHPIWDENEKKLMGIIGAVQDITERKLIEIALRKSEENYRLLIDNQNDLIVKIDRDNKFLFVSPSYYKLFGKTEEELIGNSFYPLVHPDDIVPTQQAMQELNREPYTCYVEQRAQTIDGWTWIAWSDKAVLDADGNIEYIIGVGRDINKIKLAEENLKSSEEKFHKAFDTSPDAININRLHDGLYISINKGFTKVTGYTEQEIIGKTSAEIGIWANINDRNKLVEGISKNGYYENLEAQFRTKNGEFIFGLMSASIIELNGEPHILSITRDITTRKIAETNIKKLSIGMEQSPAITLITNVDGNIEYANPKFTEISGYTFDEVKGKPMRILFSSEGISKNYGDLWETLLEKRDWKGEFLNTKKNGEKYWESVLISPIVNDNGEITNFIGIMEDITERKNLTTELMKAKENAEEMNKIKSFFFANMSHELRTPFVGIMGFAEVLSESVIDPEQKKLAEAILISSQRLTDTLNKILNVTSLEFSKLDLNFKKFDIHNVINRIINLYQNTAKKNNVVIEFSNDGNPLMIISDEKIIEDILQHLINNSIKFTSEGFIKVSAEALSRDDQQLLILKVADSGIGIPKEMQDIIFLEFRQASEGLNRSFEGTGLGLTITKKYVELLGGKITLNSEVGKGSEFIIEIPVKMENGKTKIQSKDHEKNNLNKKENLKLKQKLLYVEDDSISLQFIKLVLSKSYNVDAAGTAEIALKMVDQNLYDALLLDINLGRGMDGVELAQIIRQKPGYKSVPMIAVTAYASDADREEFLAKGFDYYLSKPFVSSELLDLMKNVLKS